MVVETLLSALLPNVISPWARVAILQGVLSVRY